MTFGGSPRFDTYQQFEGKPTKRYRHLTFNPIELKGYPEGSEPLERIIHALSQNRGAPKMGWFPFDSP